MAGPWFRFYAEVLNDPKIIRLTDKEFRAWVLMLCIAAENDGNIDCDDLPIRLRQPAAKVGPVLESLVATGLFAQDATAVRPHNWNARQYKSDVSTARVKRFRERHETVAETPPEAEQKQSRSEADTEAVADLLLPPAHPFSVMYSQKHRERTNGGVLKPIVHGRALSLEQKYGAEDCIQVAEEKGWDHDPSYFVGALEDRKNGKPKQLQATGSASRRSAGGSPSRDELVADWERYAAGEG